jgi:hypothetical protein
VLFRSQFAHFLAHDFNQRLRRQPRRHQRREPLPVHRQRPASRHRRRPRRVQDQRTELFQLPLELPRRTVGQRRPEGIAAHQLREITRPVRRRRHQRPHFEQARPPTVARDLPGRLRPRQAGADHRDWFRRHPAIKPRNPRLPNAEIRREQRGGSPPFEQAWSAALPLTAGRRHSWPRSTVAQEREARRRLEKRRPAVRCAHALCRMFRLFLCGGSCNICPASTV